jgi:copper chaperone
MTHSTYKVAGMTCEGCVGSLTKALSEALGDTTIEVRLAGGQVRVEGEHDAKLVEDTVEAAGFDFVGSSSGSGD